MTDWLPTLISAAGGDFRDLVSDNIDGIDQWEVLRNGLDKSKRTTLLYNINPLWHGGVNGAVRDGKYKLIIGDPGRVSGRIPVFKTNDVSLLYTPLTSEDTKIMANWEQLFELDQDPFESKDLSSELPEIVESLRKRFW